MLRPEPYRHPSAWKSSDFRSKDDVAVDLTPRHVTAFEAALAGLKSRGLISLDKIGRNDFPLAEIADDVAKWVADVEGRGILLLRGFPVDTWSQEDVELVWFGLGTHFGRAVSQSSMGDLLGHVVNIGGKDNKERAYRNSRELRLHTDYCDVVGMFSLMPAMTGGISRYASAIAVYNEIAATRPELLEPLRRGFHIHRFGEQLPGEPPYTAHRVPVISDKDGEPTVVLSRGYIDMAVAEFELPFDDKDREALDLFEEIANRPDFRLDFMLQRGEAILFNNSTVLHTRTGFDDWPDPAKRRHLMRLWLNDWTGRPVVDAIKLHKKPDGIPKQGDGRTYYANRRDNQVSG